LKEGYTTIARAQSLNSHHLKQPRPTQGDISNKPVAHDRIDVSFNEHASLMQHRHGLPNHLYKIHVVLDYDQRVIRALGKAAKGSTECPLICMRSRS
jgi:hypothetical protein